MQQAAEIKSFPAERRVARWMLLVAAIEGMARARDFHDIIDIVTETARGISGADGVTFVLRDGDLSYYFEEKAISPLWKGRRFPMSDCISGWCMLNDKTAVVRDIYADARIPHDAYRPTFVKSMIMTPVGGELPVAAIGAYWADEQDFDDHQIELLEALARSTAGAIKSIQMNKAIREIEERVSILFETGKFGAWEINFATGNFIASTACRESLGRSATAPFGYDDFVAAIHPDDRERFLRSIEAVLADCTKLQVEHRMVRPDGDVRWLEINGRVTLDANGVPSRLAGVTRDITQLRRATERMERATA